VIFILTIGPYGARPALFVWLFFFFPGSGRVFELLNHFPPQKAPVAPRRSRVSLHRNLPLLALSVGDRKAMAALLVRIFDLGRPRSRKTARGMPRKCFGGCENGASSFCRRHDPRCLLGADGHSTWSPPCPFQNASCPTTTRSPDGRFLWSLVLPDLRVRVHHRFTGLSAWLREAAAAAATVKSPVLSRPLLRSAKFLVTGVCGQKGPKKTKPRHFFLRRGPGLGEPSSRRLLRRKLKSGGRDGSSFVRPTLVRPSRSTSHAPHGFR